MKNTHLQWKSADSLNLFAQAWEPDVEPQAIVCLVHGLGEHSSRYSHVAESFTAAGFAMLTFDLRGHGHSSGLRGHFPSPEAVVNDIDILLEQASERWRGKPCFIYGHSLGGLLVLYYTLVRKPAVAGVIATGPALHTALSDQKVKIALSKTLGPLLPTVSLASGLDANEISRDTDVVNVYKADPLVHDRVTFGFGSTMLKIMEYTNQHAADFPNRLLLIHGRNDTITYPQGSMTWHESAPTGLVTIKILEGLKHEVHNEPEKAEVLAEMVNWLNHTLDKLRPT